MANQDEVVIAAVLVVTVWIGQTVDPLEPLGPVELYCEDPGAQAAGSSDSSLVQSGQHLTESLAEIHHSGIMITCH